MALFPIQGVFEGDFVVLLVPIDDEDPMSVVAQKVAHHAAGHRVPASDAAMTVRHGDRVLADDDTVATAGVGPMDVLVVGYAK